MFRRTSLFLCAMARAPQHVFASGFAMSPELAQRVSEAVAASNKQFDSGVWFTERQLQRWRNQVCTSADPHDAAAIALKSPDETPIRITAPPGMTNGELRIYHVSQTTKPDFRPKTVRQPGAAAVGPAVSKAAFNPASETTTTTTTTESDFMDATRAASLRAGQKRKGEIPFKLVSLTGPDDTGCVASAYVDGAPPQHYHHFDKSEKPRVIASLHWPTLASVAQQHGWTSNVWLTRSDMRRAGLAPDVSATGKNNSGTPLPTVLRIYNATQNTAAYIAFWNRDQLVAEVKEDAVAVAAAAAAAAAGAGAGVAPSSPTAAVMPSAKPTVEDDDDVRPLPDTTFSPLLRDVAAAHGVKDPSQLLDEDGCLLQLDDEDEALLAAIAAEEKAQQLKQQQQHKA